MPTFLRRTLLPALLILLIAAGYLWIRRAPAGEPPGPGSSPSATGAGSGAGSGSGSGSTGEPPRGGQLVATLRTEPRSFNRLVASDPAAKQIAILTQGTLVRLNQVSQQLEPWLAERWETSDGLHYVLHLRRGLTFSDGTPFTAADVLFTFQALYDPKVNSPLAEAFKVDGQPLDLRATDDHTVALTFPAPYGPGLRPLDSLPILPRHRLEAALKAGTFHEAWGVSTPPAEMAGLGPFVLRGYAAGQRIELERNPRYWRRDARGAALPYLDRLTIEVTPSQSAEMLKFEAGQADLISSELRPDDIPAVRRLVDAQRARLYDLGVGPDADSLWFNLTPKGPSRVAVGGTPPRPWMARREFRQAISHAVNRQQFVDTVLLGAGAPVHGPVTPGNRQWVAADLPAPASDLAKARVLLDGIGLRDRNQDGLLEAENGTPVRFSLFTQRGHALRERAAAVLKQDLQKIGIQVDVSPLDLPALYERLTSGAYEAAYFGVLASDLDPAVNLDFWLSRGAFHLWHPAQPTPATPWEREIDGLMATVMASTDQAERKRQFDQVQRIFATEQPAIYFAAPTIVLATSTRVLNAQPALLRPQLLWAPDTLAVRDGK